MRATISPDGRWMAYQSDESGDWEVFVERFPDGGERQRISPSGGEKPLWSPVDDRLFYVNGNVVMSVPITLGTALHVGPATMLFEADVPLHRENDGIQDISPDGQRFLTLVTGDPLKNEATSPGFVFVQNWFEELRQRLPVP